LLDTLSTRQPKPRHNNNPAVWDLVLQDIKDRDSAGRIKYGTRLQPNNGRDPLVDAYQEALDLVVYLRQEIYERDHYCSLLAGQRLLQKLADPANWSWDGAGNWRIWANEDEDVQQMAAAALSAMEQESGDRWIPVTECLPEHNSDFEDGRRRILVFTQDENTEIAVRKSGRWWIDRISYPTYDGYVTHWKYPKGPVQIKSEGPQK